MRAVGSFTATPGPCSRALCAILRAVCGWFVSALILCALGCGGERLVPVTGLVTLEGEPLQNGYIAFYRQAEESAPGKVSSGGSTSGAEISAGLFRIPSDKGLFTGTFRVEITAIRPTGRRVSDDYTGAMVEEQAQFLPAHYNTSSTLTAEIKAGAKAPLVFELKP